MRRLHRLARPRGRARWSPKEAAATPLRHYSDAWRAGHHLRRPRIRRVLRIRRSGQQRCLRREPLSVCYPVAVTPLRSAVTDTPKPRWPRYPSANYAPNYAPAATTTVSRAAAAAGVAQLIHPKIAVPLHRSAARRNVACMLETGSERASGVPSDYARQTSSPGAMLTSQKPITPTTSEPRSTAGTCSRPPHYKRPQGRQRHRVTVVIYC
ncbi:alkylhydroperoxidase domain protein [Mycobacterium xenopi 3993]|nr:alkylhydroperoxidase domain protein [Mycobacterium xenopi 3993]